MVRTGTSTAGRASRGFTLIEMLVTMMIIGLAMTLVFSIDNMVPKARLQSSASDLAADLQLVRNHALFAGREVVFAYHLDRETYEAWYPVEMDDDGRVLGPGRTVVREPTRVQQDMALAIVRLADGTIRDVDTVEFRIDRLGRIAPHKVLVVNAEFQDVERAWVVVDGLTNDARVVEDVPEVEEEITDAHFR